MQDTAASLAGCLIGQALGDALGFVVESAPPETAADYVECCLLAPRAGTRSHPGYDVGQYTDDTQLARELLRSIRESARWDPASFAGHLAGLFRENRAVCAGPGTRESAGRLVAGIGWRESGQPAPYAGNGSAMRAAPLGVFFRNDPARMLDAARDQSLVTHRDSRCVAGAMAVAGAAALASLREWRTADVFLEQVAVWVEDDDRSVADAIRGVAAWIDLAPDEAARRLHASGLDSMYADSWLGISAFVTPSLAWSLYAFLRTPDDYWATICTAIGVGGDTDTMAAMAGAMSGARLGVDVLPADLVSKLHDRGDWKAPELVALAHDCAALAPAFAHDG
ncbi:MAG TPA: ADP-ribosylglycohydrolase family protein [Gemmatimonadales bacterium]|jgi:ADP-ribosylglycohydrolase